MKRALFIDRDGTLIREPEGDCQVDSLEKLAFMPKMIRNLYRIRNLLDYELVMVTNQDGMGTEIFPEETFWPAHQKMLDTLAGEGIVFDDILIDRSMPDDNSPNRKPRIGMLEKYIAGDYDLERCHVIGDRATDVELAHNLNCRSIWLHPKEDVKEDDEGQLHADFVSDDWDEIGNYIFKMEGHAFMERKTKETEIVGELTLWGDGESKINTGLGMLDHLIEQLAKHSGMNIRIDINGDLYVDDHHTIEDAAIALGEAFKTAMGDKRGIERYGFMLPMDDCLCSCAVDLCGRSWLMWDTKFKREKVGDVPTEMFMHFFKSFSDAANININIKAEGTNEHHKIEGIFKAFARCLRMALRKDVWSNGVPSTKGTL